MKTGKQVVLLVLCVMLLAASAVMGTLAYLTSSAEVRNTFTVGKVAITLDETDNTKTDGSRTETGNHYHLLPGITYVKDPVIHVDDDSETCYLFVKVDNEIADIEATATVADQMAANGWTLVDGTDNIYVYESTVVAGTDVHVFSTITVSGSVDGDTLASYAGKTVLVTAYAIQAEGLTDATAAYNALNF